MLPFIYIDGRFEPSDTLSVSIATQAMNYGTAAFEGMRALYIESERDWRLFRPDMHFARLNRAADLIGLELGLSQEEFVSLLNRFVRRNNCRAHLYVRPIAFANGRGIGHARLDGCSVGIFAEEMPLRRTPPRTAGLVDARRPSDGSYSAKITGNYVLATLAQRQAKQRGFQIGILRSDRGYLSEASAMNLFWRIGKTLYTPSMACGPLAGVTRDTVIGLARDRLGIDVRQGAYRPAVLDGADEIFLTGTGTGVTPIIRYESRRLSNNRNSVCNRLWSEYRKLVLLG